MFDNEPTAPHGAPEPLPPDASEAVAAGEALDAYSAAVVGAVEQVGPAVVSVYVGGGPRPSAPVAGLARASW